LVFGGESCISKITSSEFYEKVDNLTDFPTSQSSNQIRSDIQKGRKN